MGVHARQFWTVEMGCLFKWLQQRPALGCLADRQHLGCLVLGDSTSTLDAASCYHVLHIHRRFYSDACEHGQRLGCLGGSLALVVCTSSNDQAWLATGSLIFASNTRFNLALHALANTGFNALPVWVPSFTKASGVLAATTRPPPSPPSFHPWSAALWQRWWPAKTTPASYTTAR